MMGSGVHSSTEDSCMRYSESSRHAPEIEGVTHYTECLIEYSLQMPFVNIRDIFFGSKNASERWYPVLSLWIEIVSMQ